MCAAITGGTIVINSAPTRHSSMALDYEMGLVRVASSSSVFTNSAAGYKVRPNDVTMIAPSTPTKIVRSCPSTPTGLKTAHGPLNGIVSKLNNKRRKLETEEPPVSMDGKLPTENDYSSGKNGILVESQNKMRSLLVAQLDLIKKQSDAIITKDRQLRELRQENRALQQRLLNLGQNSNTTNQAYVKKGNGSLLIKDAFSSNSQSQPSTTIVTKDIAVETTSELLENYLKFPKSKDSSSIGLENNKKGHPVKSNSYPQVEALHLSFNLETDIPYYTFHGEDFLTAEAHEIKEILSQAEVPGWRTVAVPTCYSMEGTENIEDETVLKRHNKPELDEKRRKRWDLQRMRQQKQVERLRARYDSTESTTNNTNNNNQKNMKKTQGISNKTSSKGLNQTTEKVVAGISNSLDSTAFNQKTNLLGSNNYSCSGVGLKDNDWLSSLHPLPEFATHVQVSEKLPVNAFGFSVPMIPQQEFSLPWLNTSTNDENGLQIKKKCSSKKFRNGKLSVVSSKPLIPKSVKKSQGLKAASQKITHAVNGYVNGIPMH